MRGALVLDEACRHELPGTLPEFFNDSHRKKESCTVYATQRGVTTQMGFAMSQLIR